MRKYLLIVATLSFLQTYSQPLNGEQFQQNKRKEIDSLKKALPLMTGKAKIDGLNRQAYNYFSLWIDWKLEADSAYPYAIEAYNEAKKIGYKLGLGYACLRLANIEELKFGFDAQVYNKRDTTKLKKSERYVRQAIQIGEVLNDNAILAGAYWILAWLEGGWIPVGKGSNSQYLHYLDKAILYYKKSANQPRLGMYRDLNRYECTGCEGNETALGLIHLELARAYWPQQDVKMMIAYLKKGTEYYHKGKDIDREAGGYSFLSKIYGRMYNESPFYRDSAEMTAIKAASLYREIGDDEGEMRMIGMLCGGYFNIGDFEKGLENGKRSIFLADKLSKKNPGKIPDEFEWGLFWMGIFYQYAGDYQTALTYLHRTRSIPDEVITNQIRDGSIGELHRLMGNFDSAKHYLLPMADDSIGFGPGKTFLGCLYLDLKQYDEAIKHIKAAIEMESKNGNTGLVARGLTEAANVYFQKNDYKTALKYAQDGLAAMKLINMKVYMVDNYRLHSEIFHALGRDDSAYYYSKQYTRLKDSLLNRQFLWRLNNLKKEAEEQRNTSQINLLNKDNQLKAQKLNQEAFVKKVLIAALVVLLLLGVFIFRMLVLKRKNALIKQQLENDKRQAELQQKAAELEMQALRAQMNPHFIFNCLSSINKFILMNDTDAASDYLTRFSRLIRHVLTNAQLSMIPLSDEIEMLRLYLDMERLRFSESFNYNIIYENTIEPDSIYIPPMLLQPFCENAIWHGLMHKQGQGKLEIVMSVLNGELQCIIADNGIGRAKAAELQSKSSAKRKSFGLKLTTERLALFNNDKDIQNCCSTEDVVDSEGNVAGTKVTFRIKLKNALHQPAKEIV